MIPFSNGIWNGSRSQNLSRSQSSCLSRSGSSSGSSRSRKWSGTSRGLGSQIDNIPYIESNKNHAAVHGPCSIILTIVFKFLDGMNTLIVAGGFSTHGRAQDLMKFNTIHDITVTN